MKNKGEWMQTYSGHKFYPSAPYDCLDIKDIAHALSFQVRFGGHISEPYSVAQHSVLVAKALSVLEYSGHVILWGLLHDASEAYIRDLPTPVKAGLPEYKKLENSIMQAVGLKFLEGGLTTEELDAVKLADTDLLFTEARRFFGKDVASKWNVRGYDIIEGDIWNGRVWSAKRAEREFLKLYDKLKSPGQ